jgi:class 3 adenylate cyclase
VALDPDRRERRVAEDAPLVAVRPIVLGANDKLDFSALGDTLNVAARLGSVAGPGELLASRDAWVRAGPALDTTRGREVEIAGRVAPLDVVVSEFGTVASSAA